MLRQAQHDDFRGFQGVILERSDAKVSPRRGLGGFNFLGYTFSPNPRVLVFLAPSFLKRAGVIFLSNFKYPTMNPKNNSLSYDASIKEKARTLRNNPTPAEKFFWDTLREMPFYKSLTFNRQKPIEPYIVDFYCHRLQLVIEIDGDSHGETETRINDQKRTAFLESQGLTVLRFTNLEMNKNIDGVMQVLENFIENKDRCKSPQPSLEKRGKTFSQ